MKPTIHSIIWLSSGRTKDITGKNKIIREANYLNAYQVQNPTSSIDKTTKIPLTYALVFIGLSKKSD